MGRRHSLFGSLTVFDLRKEHRAQLTLVMCTGTGKCVYIDEVGYFKREEWIKP